MNKNLKEARESAAMWYLQEHGKTGNSKYKGLVMNMFARPRRAGEPRGKGRVSKKERSRDENKKVTGAVSFGFCSE